MSKQYTTVTYISSEVSDHSTQVEWHVAEQNSSLLSTKVVNSLEKMVEETSLSWGGTTQCSAT